MYFLISEISILAICLLSYPENPWTHDEASGTTRFHLFRGHIICDPDNSMEYARHALFYHYEALYFAIALTCWCTCWTLVLFHRRY